MLNKTNLKKNARIEARVTSEIKEKLNKKAEMYGGLTKFLEEIARKDIILVDREVSKLLREDVRQKAVSCI